MQLKQDIYKSMRKGLTISELLVAMTVIGVIAALVVPGFLKDYHKKLYTTQLKKVYEMIYSSIEEACGDYNVTAFSQTPYFTSTPSTTKQGEFLNTYFKVVKQADTSITGKFNSTYRSLTDTDTEQSWTTTGMEESSAKVTLKGGEALAFYCTSSNVAPKHRCYVTVDVNSTAGPNIGGRDMFRLQIDADTNEVTGQSTWFQCRPDIANPAADTGGKGCLTRIMKDNWVMEY